MPRRKLDPLPSVAFQILLALADQPLHGYAIMRQVAEQTEGRMRLGPATLYGSIQTLLEAALIEEVDAPAQKIARTGADAITGSARLGAKSLATKPNGLQACCASRAHKNILRGEYV